MTNAGSLEKQIDFGKKAIAELTKNIDLTQKQIAVGTADSFVLIQKQRDLLRKERSFFRFKMGNI